MLRRTFIHLDGIGPGLEKRLWQEGILSWDQFAEAERLPGISVSRKAELVRRLEADRAALDDPGFWAARLPGPEMWRLYQRFKDSIAYLDIETDGRYAQGGGLISVIGVYDGRAYRAFIDGYNLDLFEEFISRFKVLVTFNGSSFDVPILKAWIPGLSLPPAHIDLIHPLRRLGYRGGLKKIEPLFGLNRPTGVAGLSGHDAGGLWHEYRNGDQGALSLLVRYNRQDTVNLRELMRWTYRLMQKESLGFTRLDLPG